MDVLEGYAQQQGITEEELHIKTPEDFYNLVRKMTVRDERGKVVTYGLELDQDGEQFFLFWPPCILRSL